MAKRGRKAKGHRRRHRIGAMSLNPSGPLVMYGSIAAGFLLGDKINQAIDKAIPPDKVDSKLVGAGQVGLGAAYLFLKKGKKNLPLTIAAGVMLGAGAKRELKAFGLGNIGGYSNVRAINGYQEVEAVNGRRRLGGFNPLPGGMGLNGKFQTVYDAAYNGNGLASSRY